MIEDILNKELSRMVQNILDGKTQDNPITSNEYVDEKAEAFLQSLRDMVK